MPLSGASTERPRRRAPPDRQGGRAMTIAIILQQYLDDQDVPYDVLAHQRTRTARQTARVSEVPADCLAKAVVLRDGQGYVMAVLPASCQLDKAQLWRLLHRPVELAEEDEA